MFPLYASYFYLFIYSHRKKNQTNCDNMNECMKHRHKMYLSFKRQKKNVEDKKSIKMKICFSICEKGWDVSFSAFTEFESEIWMDKTDDVEVRLTTCRYSTIEWNFLNGKKVCFFGLKVTHTHTYISVCLSRQQ